MPGGHIEATESPSAAAARELLEETGIQGTLSLQDPIDIDCHDIPASSRRSEPEHIHIDLRYLMSPQGETVSIDLSEVEGATWSPFSELESSRLRHILSEHRSI